MSEVRPVLSAGAIIARGDELLLVERYGNWGFPKGHVEVGLSETAEAAVAREVKEETGLLVLVGAHAGTICRKAMEYVDGQPPKEVDKELRMYWTKVLGYSDAPAEEGTTARWFNVHEAAEVVQHDADRKFILDDVALYLPLVDVAAYEENVA